MLSECPKHTFLHASDIGPGKPSRIQVKGRQHGGNTLAMRVHIALQASLLQPLACLPAGPAWLFASATAPPEDCNCAGPCCVGDRRADGAAADGAAFTNCWQRFGVVKSCLSGVFCSCCGHCSIWPAHHMKRMKMKECHMWYRPHPRALCIIVQLSLASGLYWLQFGQ